MSPRRAQVPEEPFARRPSALEKLTGGTDPEETTATQHRGETVLPHGGDAARRYDGRVPAAGPSGDGANEKISFYLRPDQVDRLDELALAYRRRTGTRLNRNELVRRLIDRADLDLLVAPPEA